jgi:hypothetical protein
VISSAQISDCAAGSLATCAVERGNIRASFSERECHALPQSLPCASDEGNFSIKFE